MAKLKKRTTIYLNDELAKKIKIFALNHDVSTSKLIEDIMENFLHDCLIFKDCYPKGGHIE